VKTRWAQLVLVLLVAGGCESTSPDPPELGEGDANVGSAYADLVLAFSESGAVTSCGETIPECGTPATCGPIQVLGANDTQTYSLAAQGSIELAFLCDTILENVSNDGSETVDFRIWATVPSGASAVVEVSHHGSTNVSLDTQTATDQGFDLARASLGLARFVRVSHDSGEPILIDAIEALRN
jgi:hypothetical protein